MLDTLWGSPGHPHVWLTGKNSGVPMIPSGSIIHKDDPQNWMTQESTTLTITVSFKGHKSGPAKRRDTQSDVWESLEHGDSMPSACGVRMCHLLSTLVFTYQELLQVSVSRNFLGISLYRHDWLAMWMNSISSYVIDVSSSSPSFLSPLHLH